VSAVPQPRPTEEQLKAWMLAVLAGDARSHEALLRAARPLLAAFFTRRISGDATIVDDLVQEVLIVIHERRASYDRSRPLTPWLYTIARHKMIDHFRRCRRQRHIPALEEDLVAEGFGPRCDASLDVTRLLSLLPEKQARAIRYTRLQEMSVADAAQLAGIGESDLKVSAHRGIRALERLTAAAGLKLGASPA
jgi:RNA polymerase sigma-70 factor (ECF subfamily)